MMRAAFNNLEQSNKNKRQVTKLIIIIHTQQQKNGKPFR